MLATYSGLTITTGCEVLGGIHGAGYRTGTAIGKAAIFGRVAGRSLSQ